MTGSEPFDTALPSPIGRLLELRAGAAEAVVRDSGLSEVQALMASPGPLEESLWNVLGQAPPVRLLVLTGSAGSGKSATMRHLLDRDRRAGGGRIGAYLADATHSDAPDRGQVERLADFFRPFEDGSPEPAEPCRAIAMNTGMALRFFTELPGMPGKPALGQLESLLRARLGLPRPAGSPGWPGWMDAAVVVVNLDQRSTSGAAGSLFERVLAQLDPADPAGVLEGTPRCRTCSVASWCWPMANAVAISAEPGRRALDEACGDVALERGRQVAPRALWDVAAELALGGLDADRLQGRDPCYAVADLANAGDEAVLVHAMACNGALGPVLLDAPPLVPAGSGGLLASLAARDPSYRPTREAHILIADSGLDPAADAGLLLRSLAGSGDPHPAALRAAEAIEGGSAATPEGDRLWGRVLARAAWLGGGLAGGSRLSPDFAAALAAQAAGAEEWQDDDLGRALDRALSVVELGLARTFGLVSEPDHYYPTATPEPGDAGADLMVRVSLVDGGDLATRPDPVREANPRGADIAGYRPLTLSLEVSGRHVAVDHPLWQLLAGAASGAAAPSGLELERFLALRQAIQTVGVRRGAEPSNPLLVRQRGASGRRFRIVSRNATGSLLRATEVL